MSSARKRKRVRLFVLPRALIDGHIAGIAKAEANDNARFVVTLSPAMDQYAMLALMREGYERDELWRTDLDWRDLPTLRERREEERAEAARVCPRCDRGDYD